MINPKTASPRYSSRSLFSPPALLCVSAALKSFELITFFEITTAVAFYLFSKQKADFLILETGLGGRLDATNVIKNSLINIITPIDIDHQEYQLHSHPDSRNL